MPVGIPVSMVINIILRGFVLFIFIGIAMEIPSGILCNSIAKANTGPKSDIPKKN